MRILDYLDWNLIQHHHKPFIGFSDNTAILLSIVGKTGNPVIHGPNVVSFANASKETLDSFYTTLVAGGDKIVIKFPRVIKPGKGRGILKGGNLATISHLLGTRFQPDFTDAVLFIEDIGEPAYKLDRMLIQMKMAGLFDGIRGVITGSFERCDTDAVIYDILSEIFEPYHFPVLSGLDAGHGQINLSLCMGAEVEMDTVSSRILWM
jgi:muramoyltetrapeptide carboxypeptidase